jgi:hypothetical protein
VNSFFADHEAYSALHPKLPPSIAHALEASPVGFLAWVYQLIHTVSDKIESAGNLITRTLLLYLPGVYSNTTSYKELFAAFALVSAGQVQRIGVPTSVLQFGGAVRHPAPGSFQFVGELQFYP